MTQRESETDILFLSNEIRQCSFQFQLFLFPSLASSAGLVKVALKMGDIHPSITPPFNHPHISRHSQSVIRNQSNGLQNHVHFNL